MLREALRVQVLEFGRTPRQLFRRKHPQRHAAGMPLVQGCVSLSTRSLRSMGARARSGNRPKSRPALSGAPPQQIKAAGGKEDAARQQRKQAGLRPDRQPSFAAPVGPA